MNAGLATNALGAVINRNNRAIQRWAQDRGDVNPRVMSDAHWSRTLETWFPEIRREWDAFATSGRRLPLLDDLIGEHQGNEGAWRAGLLISRGRPVEALRDWFPATIAAALGVPGIWSALFSVFGPGTELPAHRGPNAGVLRYHLGIECGEDSALVVDGLRIPYRDGVSILFDDTATHEAWNHGSTERVTLFCEVLRPCAQPYSTVNQIVQRLLSLDPRYASAPRRAREWDRALNPRHH